MFLSRIRLLSTRGACYPRPDVVGDDLCSHTPTPIENRSHFVRGAIVQQPTQQRRIRSTGQQHRDPALWVFIEHLSHQLLGSPWKLAIRAVDQPERGIEIKVVPAPLQLGGTPEFR